MDREDFINLLSDELNSDTNNYRLNTILESADDYANYQVEKHREVLIIKMKEVFDKYSISYNPGGFGGAVFELLNQLNANLVN